MASLRACICAAVANKAALICAGEDDVGADRLFCGWREMG